MAAISVFLVQEFKSSCYETASVNRVAENVDSDYLRKTEAMTARSDTAAT